MASGRRYPQELRERAVRMVAEACWSRRTGRPAGAGQLVRTGGHQAALEQAVLTAFTTRPACARSRTRRPASRRSPWQRGSLVMSGLTNNANSPIPVRT